MDVAPTECIAFEDSFNGLLSAKSAKMKTVVVPEKTFWEETKFDIADFKLKSLADFKLGFLEKL